jgi:hypothetical protein
MDPGPDVFSGKKVTKKVGLPLGFYWPYGRRFFWKKKSAGWCNIFLLVLIFSFDENLHSFHDFCLNKKLTVNSHFRVQRVQM